MRVLVVHAGPERVAVPAVGVVEVVPAVSLSPVAGAPEWVAGLARHRGVVVPVVDLHRLATGQPCPERLSSRLVVVEVPTRTGHQRMGLLVDRADDLYDLEPGAGEYRPPAAAGRPDLGALVPALGGVVRLPDLAAFGALAFGAPALTAGGGA